MNVLDVLDNYYAYKEQDIYTDEYQSALDIDLAVILLKRNGKITDAEIEAFYYLLGGYSFRKISLMLNFNRKIISTRLKEIVEMVREFYNA